MPDPADGSRSENRPDPSWIGAPERDPKETEDLAGTAIEDHLADGLLAALSELEAPADQLVRLGFG